MQYLSKGLLNEDEALKLILQGRPFGSGSSSATSSPVGTPVTTSNILAVRALTRNGVRKSPTEKDLSSKFEAKVDENASLTAGDEKSINDSMYVTALGDESSFEHSTAVDATVVNEAAGAADSCEDDEVEDSIYSMSRHSLHEDVESPNDGTFATAVTTPATLSPSTEIVEVEQKTEIDRNLIEKTEVDTTNNNDDDKVPLITIDVPTSNVATTEKPKRRQLMSVGSSTSSKESGTSFSLNLAVPHLAGFIESWNPFGSGRFFDTPPEGVENERFGFTLKPEVRIGALNEASSQALMQLFDQVF